MILSQEVKDKIWEEFKDFEAKMYAGKTKKERKALGQVFTPPALSIQLLEILKWDTLAGRTILDPCCGSGNLLAAALLAGADPDKVFGNDFDPIMVQACRDRLDNLCTKYGLAKVQPWQIHQGDGRVASSYEFSPETSDRWQDKMPSTAPTLDLFNSEA